MLEDIHRKEDWKSLKTNVGNAANVPDAILGLLSENEDEVEKAYWQIDNHVVLQSDLSESARFLPKYLEEAFIKSKYKGSVLELLFQIGNGASLDKELEEDCYKQVIAVLKRVVNHKDIIGTNWQEAVQEDIHDLEELYNERT